MKITIAYIPKWQEDKTLIVKQIKVPEQYSITDLIVKLGSDTLHPCRIDNSEAVCEGDYCLFEGMLEDNRTYCLRLYRKRCEKELIEIIDNFQTPKTNLS